MKNMNANSYSIYIKKSIRYRQIPDAPTSQHEDLRPCSKNEKSYILELGLSVGCNYKEPARQS